MRARRGLGSIAVVPLLALVGCSILTDIPDDLSSGSRDGGSSSGNATQDGASSIDGARDVDLTDSGGTPQDSANPDTGGPSVPGVVTLDSVAPSPQGAGGNNKTSPLVWSHTTSGTNRALFVTVVVDADPDTAVTVSAVKYEGVALTQVGIQHSNNQSAGYVTLWALANPPLGAHSVSVEFTGDPEPIIGGSISFTGVDQTTPFQNVTKVGGAGTKAKASVTSAVGNMVIAAVVGACDISAPENTTGWLKNVTCANGGGNGASSAFTGAASVDTVYGISGDWWGVIGADVKAASP